MNTREAIILAGGFGTRLQSLVSDVPKPMAPVNGKPFLDYLFHYLKHFNYNRIILSTGHLADKIYSAYGNEFSGMELRYCEEKTPLGTGGALKFSLSKCETENVLVLNGDSFFDVEINKFSSFHKEHNSVFTLALRKIQNADRYGTIVLDETKISTFKEKNNLNRPGIINAGVYMVNRNFFLEHCPSAANFSLEKDFLEQLVEKFPFYGYLSEGYFIDIGIPEDFNRAQHDFKEFKY